VRVALLKLDGVQSVDVSLEHGLATVSLRAGNHLTIQQFRTAIKRNGFNPGAATVEATGQLVSRGSAPALSVSGTDNVLLLMASTAGKEALDDAQKRLSSKSTQPIVVTGVLTQAADGDRIEVRSVKDAPAAH